VKEPGNGSGPGTAAPGDGRNIDPAVGILEGEASEQKVPSHRTGTEGSAPFDVWPGPAPGDGGPTPWKDRDATYYDRPVLKRPVWIWAVPAYFYAGGAAGAAAVLGTTAQLLGREEHEGLITRCRWVSAIGGAVGTGLLVYDLGRPERFLNMLRVFRPSSPLNVGSWVLATAGPLMAASAVLSGTEGALGTVGDVAGLGAGVVGLPLSAYTAVLLSNTAVPVWTEARRTLPSLFVASAMTSAASLLELMNLSPREVKVVHRFGVTARVAELIAMAALEREVGRVEHVRKPLKEGKSGLLLKVAKVATAASLVLSLLPGKRKDKRTLAALLGTAGALCHKFGVFYAGQPSALDPKATFRMQRAGHGGAEVTGRAAVTGPDDRRALD
jgi:formate-dependent nitrite reductase membrane component NrfD